MKVFTIEQLEFQGILRLERGESGSQKNPTNHFTLTCPQLELEKSQSAFTSHPAQPV
jgi:hypothetical protein